MNIYLLALLFLGWNQANAATSETQNESDGKKVIGLESVPGIQIELPNQFMYHFGKDLEASLVTHLTQSGRYIVSDAAKTKPFSSETDLVITPSQYRWPGSVLPSATVKLKVIALNFQTGFLGESTFYGFDQNFVTPFNDGSGMYKNEFPLKTSLKKGESPSWFGNIFDKKGVEPFDSHSGLDLGEGFYFTAGVSSVDAKYALYHSELDLEVTLTPPFGGQPQVHLLAVSGDGLYFDVVGAYRQYSGGIMLARKDVMEQSFRRIRDATVDVIEAYFRNLPYLAKVDAVLPDGTVLLGTGPSAELKPGLIYEGFGVHTDDADVRVQVDSSAPSGTVAHLVQGKPYSGMVLRYLPPPTPEPNDDPWWWPFNIQLKGLRGSGTPTLAWSAYGNPLSGKVPKVMRRSDSEATASALPEFERFDLPWMNLPEAPDLTTILPKPNIADIIPKKFIDSATLAYRVGRFLLHDQSYRKISDLGLSYRFDYSQESWGKQIGLDQVASTTKKSGSVPIVAVIDSGVDYNHPVLHSSIWKWTGHYGAQNGWDYISNDDRSFDDNYHGTQVASVIVNLASEVEIMPIKAFSPYGITTSAAMYASFVYAVDHGAKVIVCAWATPVKSLAIEKGIQYARDHGVIVVAAAGTGSKDTVSLPSNVPVYPANFSVVYDNVLTVTGVDTSDTLIPNAQLAYAQIAAPGKSIRVAEPRIGEARVTDNGIAAAVVAGALARNLASDETASYRQQIEQLLRESDYVPSLGKTVRLRLRR